MLSGCGTAGIEDVRIVDCSRRSEFLASENRCSNMVPVSQAGRFNSWLPHCSRSLRHIFTAIRTPHFAHQQGVQYHQQTSLPRRHIAVGRRQDVAGYACKVFKARPLTPGLSIAAVPPNCRRVSGMYSS